MGVVTLGVDIGQKRDPTAKAVIDAEFRKGGEDSEEEYGEVHHIARHLERLALGTPYPQVAQRVAEVTAEASKRTEDAIFVYIDATGVGTPVVDVLEATRIEARIVPVYFTHGDRRTEKDGEVMLGKAWLVSRLQMLLQSALLHLPRTSEAEALRQELMDYEIRISEDANDRYGAFRVGTHDDLVTAVGLAVQEDPVSYSTDETMVIGGDDLLRHLTGED
jgi:hypothetical protein